MSQIAAGADRDNHRRDGQAGRRYNSSQLAELCAQRPHILQHAQGGYEALLAPLRAAGLSELAILDLSYVVGMFTWANQLFLSLGEVERTEPIIQEQ